MCVSWPFRAIVVRPCIIYPSKHTYTYAYHLDEIHFLFRCRIHCSPHRTTAQTFLRGNFIVWCAAHTTLQTFGFLLRILFFSIYFSVFALHLIDNEPKNVFSFAKKAGCSNQSWLKCMLAKMLYSCCSILLYMIIIDT